MNVLPKPAAPPPRPKILVVDDTPANLLVMRRLLAKVDADLVEASSGNAALAASLDHDFALILLDVQMPEMDGFEVAEFLSQEERSRSTPIIFVTAAYADDMNRVRGYGAGAVDYIVKPVNELILLSKVRVFLELYRGKQQLQQLLDELRAEVAERQRLEEVARHQATHDPLTGLANRILFVDRLQKSLARSGRNGTSCALFYIDIDNFKPVNDRYGHHAGDELLRQLAQRMLGHMREVDTVARLGGDEFVIVLPDADTGDGVAAVIDAVIEAISTPVTIDGHELLVTPSIGGCLYPRDGEDAGSLLKHADVAMYHAKAAGRSNIQWFTPDMMRESADRLALGSALRRAMENEDLRLHYQPEVCLNSGRIVGMEALLRWHHPEHGYISPARFIPVAEETGQIVALGAWVLETACREAVAIQQRTGQPLVLAVNVSPRQFQPGWPQTVREALQRSGLRPQHLELEITEGMLMRNPEESAELLRQLRALGVTVVIDDFGTGYSSLSYLTRFPIDKIKIDRSFVRDLGTDATDAAVINAIIAMARSLNVRVIAEGVESQAQQAYLRERGCDEAQGFYYSEAVPAERFMAQAA